MSSNDWSTDRLLQWLRIYLTHEEYSEVEEPLYANNVDGKTFLGLTPIDVKDELCVSNLWARKRLMQAAERLRAESLNDDLRTALCVDIEQVKAESAVQQMAQASTSTLKMICPVALDAHGAELRALKRKADDSAYASLIEQAGMRLQQSVVADREQARILQKDFDALAHQERTDAELATALHESERAGRGETFQLPSTLHEDVGMVGSGSMDAGAGAAGGTVPVCAEGPHEEQGECSSCRQQLPRDHVFGMSCGHAYCKVCLERFLQEITKTSQGPPKCCSQSLRMTLVREILGPHAFLSLEQRLFELCLGNTMYCSNRHCQYPIDLEKISSDVFSCPQCNTSLCSLCKSFVHPLMTCEEYMLQAEGDNWELASVLTLAVAAKWKRCGRCKNLIQLSTGCNHMTCTCGHQFCYVCGLTWRTCKCSFADLGNIIEEDQEQIRQQHREEQRNVKQRPGQNFPAPPRVRELEVACQKTRTDEAYVEQITRIMDEDDGLQTTPIQIDWGRLSWHGVQTLLEAGRRCRRQRQAGPDRWRNSP